MNILQLKNSLLSFKQVYLTWQKENKFLLLILTIEGDKLKRNLLGEKKHWKSGEGTAGLKILNPFHAV